MILSKCILCSNTIYFSSSVPPDSILTRSHNLQDVVEETPIITADYYVSEKASYLTCKSRERFIQAYTHSQAPCDSVLL